MKKDEYFHFILHPSSLLFVLRDEMICAGGGNFGGGAVLV